LLIFLFIINVGASFYMPIFSVFVTQHIIGATLASVGVATAIYAIIKSLIQVPVAKKLDSQSGEISDFYVLLIGASTGVIYSFGFLFINSVWQLYILQLISGVGDAFLMAAYYAIFAHHIDRDSQGFEWSLLSVGGLTVSTAVGGAIGGYVAQYYGFKMIFVVAGIFNMFAVFLLILLYPYIKVFRKTQYYKTISHDRPVKTT
jgi:MFS family permease